MNDCNETKENYRRHRAYTGERCPYCKRWVDPVVTYPGPFKVNVELAKKIIEDTQKFVTKELKKRSKD